MRPNRFYGRPKVRLIDLRAIRAEMCVAYRAAVRKELDWADLRAGIACLSAIAQLDQGAGVDQQLAELRDQLAAIKAHANGSAGRPEVRV